MPRLGRRTGRPQTSDSEGFARGEARPLSVSRGWPRPRSRFPPAQPVASLARQSQRSDGVMLEQPGPRRSVAAAAAALVALVALAPAMALGATEPAGKAKAQRLV